MKRSRLILFMAMIASMAGACSNQGKKVETDSAPYLSISCGERAIGLSAVCDSAKTAEHIAANPARWKAAFDFISSNYKGDLAPGTYPLMPDDEVFAIVSEYVPKEADSCRFEAHRRYIDLQFIAAGREVMGVASPQGLTVVEPYVDDIEFYSPEGVESARYTGADSTVYFTFFPDDPHRPSMKAADADSADMVKKIVVKIKY